MAVITQQVSICKTCDKDANPLEIPEESCGHDAETHRTWTEVRAIQTVLTEEDLERLADRLNDAYAVLRTVPHHTPAVSPVTGDRVNMSGLADDMLELAAVIRP